MLRALWAHVERGLPTRVRAEPPSSLLDVIATTYAMEHRADTAGSSVAAARRAQIKRFIEGHLRDADLSAIRGDRARLIGTLYTDGIFRQKGRASPTTSCGGVSTSARASSASVLWQGRSITDTAFAWGFSSMAHFTRAFKEHFTVTPTEYRRSRTN